MFYGKPAQRGARICLGVCTFKRPHMLAECLASLARMQVPSRDSLFVVVADNNRQPVEQGLVDRFGDGDRAFIHVHERRQGIAFARNAILTKAREIGAEWVAMVDDDQQVPEGWLQEMMGAQRATGADVVRSSIDWVYPEPAPRWAFPKTRNTGWRYGLRHAATNGVLFRARIQDASGKLLWFDDHWALTGSEDRDFFRRASHAGASIVQTPDAVIREFLPAEKLSFSYQVHRDYCIGATEACQDARFYGLLLGMLKKSVRATSWLAGGIGRLALSAPMLPVSVRRSRKLCLDGSKRLAKAAGTIAGLSGLAHPELYRNVHGG